MPFLTSPSIFLTLFTPPWHFCEDPPGWHPCHTWWVASAAPAHCSVSSTVKAGPHCQLHQSPALDTSACSRVMARPHSRLCLAPALPASVSLAVVPQSQQEATQGTPLEHMALVTRWRGIPSLDTMAHLLKKATFSRPGDRGDLPNT